jgi:hypothetical protein
MVAMDLAPRCYGQYPPAAAGGVDYGAWTVPVVKMVGEMTMKKVVHAVKPTSLAALAASVPEEFRVGEEWAC